MKVRAVKMLALTGAVLICLGLPAVAQQEVSVQFTGGYTTTFGSDAAGIYSANISAINGTPVSSGMICDDYYDTIHNNQTWNAKAYQASSLASGNLGSTMFGSTIGLNGYAQVATLVSMMFGNISSYTFNGTTISGITQSELASAIWDITSRGSIWGSLDSKAKSLVTLVQSAFSGKTTAAANYLATLTNLWILTPDPMGGKNQPQEVWVSVSEGGAAFMYLLLAGLICFGAMFYRSRKQLSNSRTV